MLALSLAWMGFDGADATPGADNEARLIEFTPSRDGLGARFPGLERSLAVLADRATSGPPSERAAARAEIVAVIVQAAADHGATVETLLRALGADGLIRHGDVIAASVPGSALPPLSSDDRVLAVMTPPRPVPDAVLGEGVAYIGADAWHAAGITGAAVKVAVIDLGFQGYPALLGTELPSAVTTQNYCDGGLENEEKHGTAVAEIVHEVAPDADLYLVCIDDLADLANAIDYAVAQGVHVINHSVSWFNTGRGDGSGLLAPLLQAARSNGIVWVNSAGNQAQNHWMGTFSDTDSDGWHNFAPDDESVAFSLAHGQSVVAFLRWDDWPTSTNDFDLYLFREGVSEPVAASTNEQSPDGFPPIERLDHTATGATATYHLRIHKHDATATPTMDLFVIGPAAPIQHNVPGRSVTEPATSSLVTGVGAVDWQDGTIRVYSARGPTIDERTAPDLVGPDGVANATYGTFAGTSASSPHVAGAAALLRQAHPTAGPADIHHLLVSLTIDAGSPGPDNAYGAGILDLGDPPVGSAWTPTVGLVDPSQGQWHLRNSLGQVTSFYFGNPHDIPFMGDWNCDGIQTPGLYRQSDGFVYLRNSNTQGVANITFFFGNPGDVPIVGDFNANGCDTVSIYRPSNQTFYIINQLGQDGGGLGAAEFSYVFGNPDDKPFTGDFNGNGITTVGLHRESTGFVYYRNTHTQGIADNQFFFGDPGDRFVAGDWNGNGIDSPAVFRPSNTTFFFRFTNTQGVADHQFVFGEPPFLPVAGRFGLG